MAVFHATVSLSCQVVSRTHVPLMRAPFLKRLSRSYPSIPLRIRGPQSAHLHSGSPAKHPVSTSTSTSTSTPTATPTATPPPPPSYHTLRNIDGHVAQCEQILAYTAQDKRQLLEALNSSTCYIEHDSATTLVAGHTALAVLGDARMAGVLCKWWWGAGQSGRRSKGEWTAVRHDRCGNGALAALGRELGLQRCMLVNPGLVCVSDKQVATLVEAVLGAVWLDGGEEELERVMRRLGLDRHAFLA